MINNAKRCSACAGARQVQAGCEGMCKGCWKEAHGMGRYEQSGPRKPRRRLLQARTPAPIKSPCHNCKVRWAQDRSGHCRTCARILGAEARTVQEMEAATVARQQAAEAALERADYTPRPRREVVVDGITYEVMND